MFFEEWWKKTLEQFLIKRCSLKIIVGILMKGEIVDEIYKQYKHFLQW